LSERRRPPEGRRRVVVLAGNVREKIELSVPGLMPEGEADDLSVGRFVVRRVGDEKAGDFEVIHIGKKLMFHEITETNISMYGSV